MDWWEKYQVDVPEGQLGDWAISKFTITEEIEKWERLRAAMSYSGRYARVGTYTRLTYCGAVIMSDTPDEIKDHFELFQGKGHILLNGLGLGVALNWMAQKEDVTKVTVIELSQDVINLVADHYYAKFGDKIEIIHADALTWEPPKNYRYGFVWHDIWPTICSDNLPEMHKLHRKYGRRCDNQASWARYLCERQK